MRDATLKKKRRIKERVEQGNAGVASLLFKYHLIDDPPVKAISLPERKVNSVPPRVTVTSGLQTLSLSLSLSLCLFLVRSFTNFTIFFSDNND